MQNLWNDNEAASFTTDLALRVYTSRLLGRDHTLVLHGGGNTSVKVVEKDIFGEDEDLLYVKGSGWDLVTIEAQGFTPVRLGPVRRLADLPVLSDPQMVAELAKQIVRPGAPAPSVETILHALLPYKYVDHTHADAVLAVTNTRDGEARIRDLYGDDVVVVPYVMPGFDLARLCRERFFADRGTKTIGMVLMNHGIFSFGESARESYERMIALVGRAEAYLAARKAWHLPTAQASGRVSTDRMRIARLRREVSKLAGAPMIVATCPDPAADAFARRSDVSSISQQGPATPDHVLRTKRVPLVGTDLERYAAEYRAYFARHAPSAKEPKTMLDAAPRVVLDPEFGMLSVGRTRKDAGIVEDLYRHTLEVIQRSEMLGGYRALPERDIFDVEYWDLEQAKLRQAGKPAAFAGEVALVTGAASGIGKACAEALLAAGAAVVGIDIDARIDTVLSGRSDFTGVRSDVTDESALASALDVAARQYGGLDILVLNAGIFPGGRKIADLPADEWRRVMAVNLDANVALLRLAVPLLKLAPRAGRVVVVGSKNVPAPGPGAAAYSASKAAMTQLARVGALEWGADGIRINVVHPNAVFDTGIWTDEVLADRARHHGMTIAEYKRNNVLRTEVTSADVAAMVVAMCGPAFAKTTGAQVPVDGGNDRVI